jgi:hypothetical protein
MNMNVVRLSLSHNFFYNPNSPNEYKETVWEWLDEHIRIAQKYNVYLILQLGDVEGAQFIPVKGVPYDYRIWEDAQLQNQSNYQTNTYLLSQNYPNPFNASTEIIVELPKTSEIELVVSDLLGRRVRTLEKKTCDAGMHSIVWEGMNDSGEKVGSGFYIYSLYSRDRMFMKKMIVLQ